MAWVTLDEDQVTDFFIVFWGGKGSVSELLQLL